MYVSPGASENETKKQNSTNSLSKVKLVSFREQDFCVQFMQRNIPGRGLDGLKCNHKKVISCDSRVCLTPE